MFYELYPYINKRSHKHAALPFSALIHKLSMDIVFFNSSWKPSLVQYKKGKCELSVDEIGQLDGN